VITVQAQPIRIESSSFVIRRAWVQGREYPIKGARDLL
jgi:hypothetical protein